MPRFARQYAVVGGVLSDRPLIGSARYGWGAAGAAPDVARVPAVPAAISPTAVTATAAVASSLRVGLNAMACLLMVKERTAGLVRQAVATRPTESSPPAGRMLRTESCCSAAGTYRISRRPA